MSVPSSVSKLPSETGSGETPSHGGYGGDHGHLPKGGRVGTQSTLVEAVTMLPATSTSGSPSLSELMKQAPSTTSTSGSPSLSELMKQTPSATSTSGGPSLSELMKQAPLTTSTSGGPSLSELMKQAPSTTSTSGGPSLSELMKQAPSTTSTSGGPSLSELMKQAPSTTSTSGSPSLSELMKQAPLTTSTSGGPSLSELMKQAPSATSTSGSPSLSELMKQVPSTTSTSGSPSLSELMKQAPSTTSTSGSLSLSELMKQAPSATSTSGSLSLSELMRQTQEVHSKASSPSPHLVAGHCRPTSHSQTAVASDSMTLADLMKQLDINAQSGHVAAQCSDVGSGDSSLVASRAVTMDTIFRSIANAISSTGSGGKESSESDLTKEVSVVPPAEPSPCALIVSRRCCWRCVNHRHVEAAVLKSFVRDWTGGKTQMFSFLTPSPDDVILSSRKKCIH